MSPRDETLHQRLRGFVEAGLLSTPPTRWQVFQGEIAMAPYVVSTDVTEEPRYAGAVFGHPVLRQPILFWEIGLDHFALGTGLAQSLSAVCRHLQFTYHRGMPTWDLQLLQTYPEGLQTFRSKTRALVDRATPADEATHRRLDRVLPRADDYLNEFLGSHGYIARAERYDYPAPETNNPAVPPEYESLVGFLEDCLRFPAQPTSWPLRRWPRHLLQLGTRRWREHGSLGWFGPRDTA